MSKPQEDKSLEIVITDEEARDAQVKKQFPEVCWKISIPGKNKHGYLRKIDRITYEQATGLITKLRSDPEMLRAGECILLGCWVTGDDEIKTDEDMLMAAAMQCHGAMETMEAVLKKI